MAILVTLGARTDGKEITCPSCHSTIMYFPEDIIPYYMYEGKMGGVPDISVRPEYVVCPNKKCKSHITLI